MEAELAVDLCAVPEGNMTLEQRVAKEEIKKKKQLDKKIEQAMSTLEKIEARQISDIITNEPTKHVLFVYFGVGSENDCKELENFVEKLGYEEQMMDIFPGFPHGFLEFASEESATELLSKMQKTTYRDFQVFYQEIGFKSKPKTTMFFYSKTPKSGLNKNHANELPNATASMNIPGLTLIEDFITPEEEKALFDEIDKREWHVMATRRVQHDGYEFIYGHNNVNPNNKLGPLPEWIQPLQHKLETYTDKVNGEGVGLDQLTINDYKPGDGIPPHVDAVLPFEEGFAAVSMGSGAVMNFRHPDGRQVNVYYPPRSAVIFTGEGRLEWQHSIACRKMDRVNGKIVSSSHLDVQS